MRVPQVSERIKEAPAQALRGVFAGIGQLLLITDKMRNKTPAGVQRVRTPEGAATAAKVTAGEPAGQREQTAEPTQATPPLAASTTAESTAAGTTAAGSAAAGSAAVASVPGESVTTASSSAAPASVAAKPAPGRDFDKTGNVRLIRDGEATAARPETPAAQNEPETPAAQSEPEAPAAESGPQASAPPLPNYGELSIASLRARLRSLDVSQVRELLDYERSHAGRADVISMFERRIVKLEAGA